MSDSEFSESSSESVDNEAKAIYAARHTATFNNMIAEDCAMAEKDSDLMNLYRAGVEQMNSSPDEKLGFSDEMDRLARVIFPGRFVDHLALLIKNSKEPNIAELQKSIVEKLSKAEMQLMTAITCSIIALYLRDYPVQSANLQGMYQVARMMSRQNDSQCSIL